MKVKTLQIVWHAVDGKRNDPIMAVDIDRSGVLATAGADGSINLWRFKREEAPAAAGRSAVEKSDGSSASVDAIEFVVSLQLHDKTVNCVRFAPDGRTLASASDDQRIVLWRLKPGQTWATIDDERKLSRTVCSGHDGDVMDLAWSPDSTRLVSGGVDRVAIVWQAATGKEIDRLPEHLHFVQGVAWDPADQLLATQAADRTMQVFAVPQKASSRGRQQRYKRLFTAKFVPKEEHGRGDADAGAAGEEGVDGRSSWRRKRHLFESEAKLPSFVRRLNFTADGNLLLAPGGRWRLDHQAEPAAAPGDGSAEGATTASVPATLGFVRGQYAVGPGVVLPCEGVDPSVGVRSCPSVFTAEPVDWSNVPADTSPADLPGYSCVWAVAHLQQVSIYSSCAGHAVACMGHHHLDKLTDVCWSHDGSMLVMSSVDGYCSVVLFDPNELGYPVPASRRMQLLPGLAKAQSIRDAIAAKAAAKKASKAPAVPTAVGASEPTAAPAAAAAAGSAAADSAAPKPPPMQTKAVEAAAGKKRRRLAPALVTVTEPDESGAAAAAPAAAASPAEMAPEGAKVGAAAATPADGTTKDGKEKKRKRRRVAPVLVTAPEAESPPSPSDVAPKAGSFASAEAAMRPVPAAEDDGESIGSQDDEDDDEADEQEEGVEAGAWLAPEGSAE